MAYAPKEQTTVSFPEPVSFVIDLAIPAFSRTRSVFIMSENVLMVKSSWALWIVPLEKSNDMEGREVSCVAAYISRDCLDEDRPDIYMEAEISVIENTKKTNLNFCSKIKHRFSMGPGQKFDSFGLSQFILHSDIWGEKPALQLDNDTLTVRAVVKCSVVKESRQYRTPVTEVMQKRNILLYNSEFGCDFTLASTDGEEGRVHKAVLSAASPVFRRMFQSNLEECKTGRYVIPDIDGATLEDLLRFMYLGRVEGAKDNAKKLLVAADKYEVSDLKNYCEDALIDQLDVVNAVDLLMFADKMAALELKQMALRYITADPQNTLAADGAKDLFGPGIGMEIVEALARSSAK